MNTAPIDTLIAGQGLAGSLLAWQLHRRGQRIQILDDGHQSAASTVAAGLFNPITGQRLVKGPEVDSCLSAALRNYRELEAVLARPLFYPKPIWRLFQNEKERQAWEKRSKDPSYQPYLGEALDPLVQPHAPLGGFVQQQTGYLDTCALLNGLREYFFARGVYRREALDYHQLRISQDEVRYGRLRAQRLIFCEGWQIRGNPWFGLLPLTPARGTILTLHCKAPLPDVILNQGRWLMPRGNDTYRLGASYDREGLEQPPSQAEIDALLAQLPRWFDPLPSYQVVRVQSGVRPNTRDKLPWLGMHPRHPRLGVFNGFGSRGSLLIPWHAERMADLLCDDIAVPIDVDIARLCI